VSILWNPVTAGDPVDPLVAEDAIAPVVELPDLVREFGTMEAASQELLDLATQHVEEAVYRPLRNAVWTERLRIVWDGYNDPIFGMTGSVRPRAIPIQRVVVPTGAIIVDGVEIRQVPPDGGIDAIYPYRWGELWSTVTYQGGWTQESIPATLRTIILKVAVRMLQRRDQGLGGSYAPPVPGVSSPHVGDVSMSTDANYGSLLDVSDRKELKRYQYRSIL